MIDLLAYLSGKSKLDAARELGEMLNVPLSNGSSFKNTMALDSAVLVQRSPNRKKPTLVPLRLS